MKHPFVSRGFSGVSSFEACMHQEHQKSPHHFPIFAFYFQEWLVLLLEEVQGLSQCYRRQCHRYASHTYSDIHAHTHTPTERELEQESGRAGEQEGREEGEREGGIEEGRKGEREWKRGFLSIYSFIWVRKFISLSSFHFGAAWWNSIIFLSFDALGS